LYAIGYVYELGNAFPQFDVCANVSGPCDWLRNLPITDEGRWNSGNYEYPAGLLQPGVELGEDWNAIAASLHNEADRTGDYDTADRLLSDVACKAIILVARSGAIPNPLDVDYNISSVDDRTAVISARHHRIIAALQNGG